MAKILVIDDVAFARNAIALMLKSNGYDVFEAENGKEALDYIESVNPDAVLTDILMPEMEGLETIREIVLAKPNIPVIAMSGAAGSHYLDVAMKLGATTYLEKPFKRAHLLYKISSVLPGDPA
jgi:CheY-like chemotaxis protein